MKKLSIEEKAKAYDEAIERANNLYKDAVEMENNMTTKTCEIIFPELIETKDEKIRKAIIEGLREMKSSFHTISSIKIDDAIAWLEKQSEQKSYASETMNEKWDFDSGFTRMMEKEQKHAAWSEEDEKILNYLLWFYDTRFRWNDTCHDDIKFGDIVTFLKSLKDRVQVQSQWKPSDEQMEALDNARHSNPFNVHVLDTLFHDLKKLREKLV